MTFFARTAVLALILFVLWALPDPSPAQVLQTTHSSFHDIVENAQRWMKVGSFHVARLELEKALSLTSSPSDHKEILALLMNAAFNDHEYEQSFEYANTFLTEYRPGDQPENFLYVRGVSAFQTGRLDIAIASFNAFLTSSSRQTELGEVYYWRGMSELEKSDWKSAEADLKRCFEDSTATDYRGDALMSLSLLLERQGRFEEASEYLNRMQSESPQNDVLADARLRLASLTLRLGNPQRALQILKEVKPHYPSQEEESLLLRAQSEFTLDDFKNSLLHFREYLLHYPESPSVRTARLGLAWSLLKQGDAGGAEKEFKVLSANNDTVASAALFQLGMIALSRGKTPEAMDDFTTLVTKFPYDVYADKSYYQTGMIRYREQHYREARRDFLSVTQLFPESKLRADAYRMSGESSVALADFANAQYAFSQVQHLQASPELLSAARYQEGICLYHLGRFKSSVQRFDEFLNSFSSNIHTSEAYVWKGEALYQDYRFDEAERSFAEALRRLPQNPKRADAEYGLAWSLFEQKKFLSAAEAFDRFVANYSESDRRLDASLRKADCYFFLGKYDKASEMYAALASEKNSSQKSEYAAFQLAMSFIQRGESQRGIEQLQNFLVRFPGSLYAEVARFNIGWTHFSHEQYAEAVDEFRILKRQHPESQLMPRVLFNMGDAFYNLKNYDSSRVYYQKVIDDYPASPLAVDALTGLQFTYQAQGKSKEALASIEKYLEAKPAGVSTEELILKKGDLLFSQNDFAGAVQEYQRVLSLNPSKTVRAKTLHQLGRSYELLNNAQRAIACYEQIVSEFSDTEEAPAVTLALGIEYIKSKQDRSAVKLLQDFDRRYPDAPLSAEARYNLGRAMMNLSDNGTAFERFQSIIHQYPADIFADRSRLQIARLHYGRKEYQASLDTLNGIVERRGDDVAAEALLSIGSDYIALKRFKDGLQSFNDVIAQYKDLPLFVERAHLGIGECYERMHDRAGARHEYQEILKSPIDPDVRKDVEKRLKKIRR